MTTEKLMFTRVEEVENKRADLCDEMPEFWHPRINALCDAALRGLRSQGEVAWRAEYRMPNGVDTEYRYYSRKPTTNALAITPLFASPPAAHPVDMILFCPRCGLQHVDEPEHCEANPNGWTNPPHKSHLCHGCGLIWRPSDTPTNGVASTASGKDHHVPAAHLSGQREALERAIQICDEEGNEWDSDSLITEKNYAHACRDRIRALLPSAGSEV